MSDDTAGDAAGKAWGVGSGLGALAVLVLLSGFWNCVSSSGTSEVVYSLLAEPTIFPTLGTTTTCSMAFYPFVSNPWAPVLIGVVVAGVTYLVVDFIVSRRSNRAAGGSATGATPS